LTLIDIPFDRRLNGSQVGNGSGTILPLQAAPGTGRSPVPTAEKMNSTPPAQRLLETIVFIHVLSNIGPSIQN